MKDNAAAADHAMAESFTVDGQAPLIAMCYVHVLRWLDKSQQSWSDRATNRVKMRGDLNWLNAALSVHHAHLYDAALELMRIKWTTVYSEGPVAAAFIKAWKGEVWLRGLLNRADGGGIPSDNNTLESMNGTMKEDFLHRRQGLTQFLPSLARWLQNESRSDRTFGALMCSEVIDAKSWLP
jgi:hypothetical protein